MVVHLGGSGNEISENIIGMTMDGVSPVPNSGNGVTLYDGANSNTLHTNVISANGGWGIDIQHSGVLAPVSNTIIRSSRSD